MRVANVSQIAELLQKGELVAEFSERFGHGVNREGYGIYDVKTSALGPFMIKFNEALNAGKVVHYIDLRMPNADFSKLFFDCNMPMKIETPDPDYLVLRQLIRKIKTKPSKESYNKALDKFNLIMEEHKNAFVDEPQKYVHARVIYDVINQMISMGPSNTKYVVIPYGYRVTVKFEGGATELMQFEHRVSQSNSEQETVKIEIPSIKLTEKFNNYEDRINMMLFDHAMRYMDSLKPRKELTQGTEKFDRLDAAYCTLISEVMTKRYGFTMSVTR